MIDTKQRGLLEYGSLAAAYTRAFDVKWLRAGTPSTDQLLGTADLQSLADLSNSFDVIRSMRIVPISWNQILLLAGASALPVVPLILFVVPLDELIIRGVKTVLNI